MAIEPVAPAGLPLLQGDLQDSDKLVAFRDGIALGYYPFSALRKAYGAVKYLGQVATRCFFPRNKEADATVGQFRSFHIARDDMVAPAVEYPNVMARNGTTTPTGTGQDSGSGGPIQIGYAWEYPAGTYTFAKYTGADKGIIPDGLRLLSDPTYKDDGTPLVIPKNAHFWLRPYVQCQGGGRLITFLTTLSNNNQTVLGEAANYGTAGIADQRGGGVIPNTLTGGNMYYPTRIIANTTRRSFLAIASDSNAAGLSTLGNKDQSGDTGILFPSLGKRFAYTSLAVGGDRVTDMLANSTVRKSFIDRTYTDLVIQGGINDLTSGISAAALFAAVNALAEIAYAAGLRVWKCTVPPYASSSNGFIDYAGQSIPDAAVETQRVAYNTLLRNEQRYDRGGVLDLADVLEVGAAGLPSRNSGRWMFGGTGFANSFTIEGLHTSSQGNKIVERLGGILDSVGPANDVAFVVSTTPVIPAAISTISSPSVTEGSPLVFTVNLSTATPTQQTFNYAITGTATPNVDYTNVPTFNNGVTLNAGLLTVPAGLTAFTASYPTLADALTEIGETVILTIGGVLGTGTINDPAVGFAYTAWTGVGWFDASDLAGATGSVVTSLTNKRSGKGDLIYGGTAGLGKVSATLQNGRKQLELGRDVTSPTSPARFESVSTALLAQAFQGNDKPYTVIAVYTPKDANTGFIVAASATVDATDVEQVALIRRAAANSSVRRGVNTATPLDVNFPVQAADAPRIVAIKHTGTTVSIWDTSLAPVVTAAAQNANAFSTNLTFALGASRISTASPPAYLAAQSLTNYMEVVVEDSAKTDAEIQQAITDLASKWAIALV